MNNIAVIYKSKYGTTKKYAGWIALRLEADLYELSDIRSKDLDKYEIIIYGGPLYVGKIKGINFIIDNYEKISNKNIIVFTIGMESDNEKSREAIIKGNFEENISQNIKLYHFKGAFNYKGLNFTDKILMKFMKNKLESKDKRDLTDDDKNVLKGFEGKVDLSDKKYINELTDYVYNINKNI